MILNFLKYELWPRVKVRLRFWWWVVKYRGKKNIPPEILFGQIQASVKRMQENLLGALRAMPEDIGEEEKTELLQALDKAGNLQEMLKDLKKK